MKKSYLLTILLLLPFLQSFGQVLQGTIVHAEDPGFVYLRIKNNSTSAVAGNMNKLKFTVSAWTDWMYSTYLMPIEPEIGNYNSYGFDSFSSYYHEITWTGSRFINLAPGSELDVVKLQIKSSVSDVTPFSLVYASTIHHDHKGWEIEVDNVNLTNGGIDRFYNSGAATYLNNDIDGSTVRLSNYVLPVKLKKFVAYNEFNTVNLKWSTSEETKSNNFEIQHSLNAKDWIMIGSVQSHGNSDELRNYSFTHKMAKMGVNYYRLKMVDSDQTFAFSNIVNIKIDFNDSFVMYPNPASDRFKLRTNKLVELIQLFDSSGKMVLIDDYKDELVNVEKIASGIYTTKVKFSDGEIFSSKLVIGK